MQDEVVFKNVGIILSDCSSFLKEIMNLLSSPFNFYIDFLPISEPNFWPAHVPSTKQIWFAFQLVTVRTPSGKEILHAWWGEVGLTNWISKSRSNEYFDDVYHKNMVLYIVL